METVPNREKPTLVDNGVLLVSTPRNRTQTDCPQCGKYGRAGARYIECGPEVGPPSDVNIRVKPSLIREGALLPPVVRRCLGGDGPLVGSEVFQMQRTGRVAQVGVAGLLEREATRASALQGSGGLVPVSVWRRTRNRDDERADGENPTSTMSITG